MNAMETLGGVFMWVLRTSGEAAVIVLVILAAQAFLRNRLKPRWRYALWLILVARLVMPWAPESPLSIFNLVHKARETAPIPHVTIFQAEPAQPSAAPAAHAAVPSPAMEATLPSFWTPLHILSLLWLLGATAFAAHVAFENTRFWLRVRNKQSTSDPRILELLRNCRELIFSSPTRSTGRTVRIITTDVVTTPALFGFLRPRLLLPVAMAEAGDLEALRYVFLHELAHLKRHDVLMNWLTTLVQAVHWFNPLLWYAFYRMRIDREPACDALALSCLQPEESEQYGHTILDLLESVYTVRRFPGMAGILEDKSQIKDRILQISLFTRNSYRWSALACAVLAVVASVVLTRATSAESGGIQSKRWWPAVSKVYSLRAGEALRLVPPPFIPEREKIAGEPDNKTTSVFLFDGEQCAYVASVNEITKNDAGEFTIMPWLTLQGFLNLLEKCPSAGYHVPLCDVELPETLAKLPIPPGDWVLDPKAPDTEVLNRLENILRDNGKRDVHFTQMEMARDVIVASGEFKFTPLQDSTDDKTLYFFAGTLPVGVNKNGGFGGELGGLGEGHRSIQHSLEQYLGLHVFSEIHGECDGISFVMIPLTPEERQDPETPNRVLDNVARQTGLAFRIEPRTVPIWVMKEGSGATKLEPPATVTVPVAEDRLEPGPQVNTHATTEPGTVGNDKEAPVETRYYEFRHLGKRDYPAIEKYIAEELPESPRQHFEFHDDPNQFVLTDTTDNLAHFERWLAEVDVITNHYMAELWVMTMKKDEAASVLSPYCDVTSSKPISFTIARQDVEKLNGDLNKLPSAEMQSAPRVTFKARPALLKTFVPKIVLRNTPPRAAAVAGTGQIDHESFRQAADPLQHPQAYSTSFASWLQKSWPVEAVICDCSTEFFASASGTPVPRMSGILAGYKVMPIANSEDCSVSFYFNMTRLVKKGRGLAFWKPRPLPEIHEAPLEGQLTYTHAKPVATVFVRDFEEANYVQTLLFALTKVEGTGYRFAESH